MISCDNEDDEKIFKKTEENYGSCMKFRDLKLAFKSIININY